MQSVAAPFPASMDSGAIVHAGLRKSPSLRRRIYQGVRSAALAASQRPIVAPLALSLTISVVIALFELPLLGLICLCAGVGLYALRILAVALSPAYALRVYGPPGPPLAPDVLPHEVEPLELRASYEKILRTHEDLRQLLRDSGRIREGLKQLYASCTELVDVAGRIARLGNSLDAYLEACKPIELTHCAEQLEARAKQALDPEARRTYQGAAMARRRQLATYAQLQGLYDRIRARLEVVIASLDSVQALVVKLQALELDHVALNDDCVAEQLEILRGDAQIVEAAIVEASGRAA